MNAQEGHLDMALVSVPRNNACRVDGDIIVQARVVSQAQMRNNFPVVPLINFAPIDRLCHRAFPWGIIQKVEKDLVMMLSFIEPIKRYVPKEVSVWEE